MQFFAQSREPWKEKGREAKASLKQRKKKRHRGEERHRRQKRLGHVLESELARRRAAKRGREEALAAGEKEAR